MAPYGTARHSTNTYWRRNAVIPHTNTANKKKQIKNPLAISWPAVPFESLRNWVDHIMPLCVIASKRIPLSKFRFEYIKSVRHTVRRATHEPNTAPSTVRTPYGATYQHRKRTVRDLRWPPLWHPGSQWNSITLCTWNWKVLNSFIFRENYRRFWHHSTLLVYTSLTFVTWRNKILRRGSLQYKSFF
jgi:hypothetical protein